MSITVEKALPADAAEILELMKQIGGESDNLTFGTQGLPFSVEDEEAFILNINGSSDGVFLVAREDGRIVGSASLSRMPRRMSHVGDIGISVVRSHWNRGIGSMLLSSVIDFAKKNAFDFIDLQVRSDNLAAIHLYTKFGFEKIGTHPDLFKANEKYFDIDYMMLKLK